LNITSKFRNDFILYYVIDEEFKVKKSKESRKFSKSTKKEKKNVPIKESEVSKTEDEIDFITESNKIIFISKEEKCKYYSVET
jgi:hypothetical protein